MESYEQPGCIALYRQGVLAERARALEEVLSECSLCPRKCRVNRLEGELGACRVDARPKVAAMSIHPWEEPPLSGAGGSGTIFFTGCTLKCLFCQNYPISQLDVGRYMTVEELASGMLKLQKKGAQNINLVTPTHQVGAFVKALLLAIPQGFNLPVVYNTSGYESLETLRLLEGIVDIYLPDIKYGGAEAAGFCSERSDYVEHDRAAILEMWRQVGHLSVDGEGVARKGLLVRHMVLPDGLSGTRECVSFLVEHIGVEVWISLMSQYFPAHKALHTPPLDRKASNEEYEMAFEILKEFGVNNGFVQDDPENDPELACPESPCL